MSGRLTHAQPLMAVVGIVLAAVALMITVAAWEPAAQAVLAGGRFLSANAALVSCLVIIAVVSWRWRRDRRQLRELRRPEPPAKRFLRFEDITHVRYGHVDYHPLLYHDRRTDTAEGLGIHLLGRIFGPAKLEDVGKCHWRGMLDELARGKFDLIATPLFEMGERWRKAAFSAPIFFADVGVYVRAEGSTSRFGAERPESMTFTQATNCLRGVDGLVATVVVGELNAKMVAKYLRVDDLLEKERQETSVVRLIASITDDDERSDVVFAERLFADQTAEVQDGKVINLIRPEELLYPVGIAVRREENVLRNFINLRLMELDHDDPDWMVRLIFEGLRAQKEYEDFTIEMTRRYFLRSRTQQKERGTSVHGSA